MIAAILVIYLLTLLPDAYIWSNFARHWPSVWRVVGFIPSFLVLVTPLLAFSSRWQDALFRLVIALFLLVILPKLLFVLVSLAGKGMAFVWPAAFPVANIAGLGLVAIVLSAVGFAMTIGWRRIVTKEIAVSSARLPEAFDGYRIVQLSDFHIGTYGRSPETVKEIVDKVNALNADAVVFTGDLVNLDPEEVTPFMQALSGIRARDGVFTVLGNHDYCTYRRHVAPDSPTQSLRRLVAKEDSLGWTMLRNEHRIIRRGNDSIAIIGVENDGTPPFPALADLPRATAGLPDGLYKVLLSHDPTHWRRSVLPDTDIDLTLSGHTHAMQFRLGRFSPSRLTYPEWGGLYTEGTRHLFVSTGTGSNFPFRLGAWPEIDVLTLKTGRDVAKTILTWNR